MSSSPWFPWPPSEAKRPFVLFCLPHAGGRATQYRTWSLCRRSKMADVCPVELPGRGCHAFAGSRDRQARIVQDLAEEIVRLNDPRPFALFGHSLGAFICASLVDALTSRGRLPAYLFISAAVRPDLMEAEDDARLQEVLLQEVAGPDGAGDALASLWSEALPLLRADLALVDRKARPELSLPVTVFSGTMDPIAPPERVEAWRSLCSGPFAHQSFAERHLYLRNRRDEILDTIDLSLGSVEVEAPPY